jgi:hypothetical protein
MASRVICRPPRQRRLACKPPAESRLPATGAQRL